MNVEEYVIEFKKLPTKYFDIIFIIIRQLNYYYTAVGNGFQINSLLTKAGFGMYFLTGTWPHKDTPEPMKIIRLMTDDWKIIKLDELEISFISKNYENFKKALIVFLTPIYKSRQKKLIIGNNTISLSNSPKQAAICENLFVDNTPQYTWLDAEEMTSKFNAYDPAKIEIETRWMKDAALQINKKMKNKIPSIKNNLVEYRDGKIRVNPYFTDPH